MLELFLGIDIGGSHISLGLVTANHEVIEKASFGFDPNLSPQEAVDKIYDSFNQLSIKVTLNIPLWKLAGIGVGCPGQAKDGVLVAAANFPQFRNVPLVTMLTDRFNQVPVVLMNDADAALLAELKYIKNRQTYTNDKNNTSIQNACMISIGTGIGVSLYINNSLYQGSNGLIEAGHMIIDFNSTARLCGCGQRGCVEAYASCKSTALRMIERDYIDNKANKSDGLSSVNDTGDDAYSDTLNSKWVFDRAAAGDTAAESVVHTTIQALACLCINICRIVDPEVIILSGGMSHAGEAYRVRVEESVYKQSWNVLPIAVKIILSSHIGDVGIVGAAIAIQELICSRNKN